MHRNRYSRRLKSFAGLCMVIACGVIIRANIIPESTTHAVTGLTYSKLTDHPYASRSGYLQSDGSVTPSGRAISRMVITSDGKLIAGYGDWNGNSDSWGVADGRVGVVPYDIASNTWGGITYAGSEAIGEIRQINGALYIPTIDPSIYGVGGYLTNKSGTWQRVNAVPDAVHVFDIATSNGSDLLLFGVTDQYGATVWRSTDDGATWSVVQTDASTPTLNGWERYYWGIAYNGNVYTQAAQVTPHSPVKVLSGSTGLWSSGSPTAGFDVGEAATEVFDGKVVRGKWDGTLAIFDGINGSSIAFANAGEGRVKDLYINNGYLYLLNDSAIYRASSWSGPWQRLSSVSANMSSIAVDGDYIYLGDNAGSIWRSDTTISAVIQPVSTCFAFTAGVVTGYYDYENNDPAKPTCSKQVVIPDSIGGSAITAIGNGAFSGKMISSVTIPNSVTSIGKQAFANNELANLTIPDSVTVIDDEAFMNNQLATLTLGQGVTTIGMRAFSVNSIKSLAIPDSVVTIGNEAFRKNNLITLHIGSGVQTIAPGTFSYNRLESIVIPDSVTTLGRNATNRVDESGRLEGAFESNQLTSLILSKNLSQAVGPTFAANKLTSVIIPKTMGFLDTKMFIMQNPLGGDIVSSAGYATVSQFMQASRSTAQPYLDTLWYAQLYTDGPTSLHYTIYAYSWLNNGANYGGQLVNPAAVTVQYVDSSGMTLRPSETYVGDGLRSYLTKDNPFDGMSATARTMAAARYYRIGSTATITASTIAGYTLGASTYSSVLSGQATTTKFIYTTAGDSTRLSSTGENIPLTVGLAASITCIGSVMILRRQRQ